MTFEELVKLIRATCTTKDEMTALLVLIKKFLDNIK